jgi:hypothetical protein
VETVILQALEAHRPCIRSNWENLLRIERMNSPLANPDTLVHLLDTTLNDVFSTLRIWSARRLHTRQQEPPCPCGRNPLLAYFSAGRQALREGLVLAQVLAPDLTAAQRDEALTCLEQAFGHIAQREIQSFCAICQFREVSDKVSPEVRPAALALPATHEHHPMQHHAPA